MKKIIGILISVIGIGILLFFFGFLVPLLQGVIPEGDWKGFLSTAIFISGFFLGGGSGISVLIYGIFMFLIGVSTND